MNVPAVVLTRSMVGMEVEHATEAESNVEAKPNPSFSGVGWY